MKAEEFIELSMAESKPRYPSTRRHEEALSEICAFRIADPLLTIDSN